MMKRLKRMWHLGLVGILIEFPYRLKVELWSFLYRYYIGKCGTGVRIHGYCTIYFPESIEMGDNVIVKEYAIFNCNKTSEKSTLRIGNNVYIGRLVHINAHQHVVIGNDVMIADNVHITDHQHSYYDRDQPISKQAVTRPQPVRIGQGSWIGHNAVILPSVTIGQNAVIGANTIVAKDVPDYGIVATSPPRVIIRPIQ